MIRKFLKYIEKEKCSRDDANGEASTKHHRHHVIKYPEKLWWWLELSWSAGVRECTQDERGVIEGGYEISRGEKNVRSNELI